MRVFSKLGRICILPMVVLLLMFIVGCDKKEEEGYDIFYKSTEENALVSYKYQSDTSRIESLAKEFIEQMQNTEGKKGCSSLFTEGVVVDKVDFNASTLDVYFNKEYNGISSDAELLLRAGLVKTLVQIEDVRYVQLYIDGALAQYSDGTLMGLLDAADFVDDSAAGMDSIQWKKVDLFYCNERGDKLVRYSEEMAYSKNGSLERMVVEKLIKGPSDNTMQATVPSTIKVLDISVNERVCYVNLDASFLTEMVNVSAEVPVYSIVNTLCSLQGIDSVRILINGDTTQIYRDTVNLDKNLTFNHDIVEYKK